jgi:hypothetical protein
MFVRYLAKVALTSLALASLLGAGPAPVPSCPPGGPAELYSPRALRRLRTLLQLQALEARRDRLALVEAVIRHRMSVDDYLSETQAWYERHQGAPALTLKQNRRMRTINCW